MALLKTAKKNGSKSAVAYLTAIERPATQYSKVPGEYQQDLDRVLSSNGSIAVTVENQAFLGGLGSGMLKQCGVPQNGALRAEMQKFVLTIVNGSIMGSNYSDRNLGKVWGSAARQQANLASGIHVGRQIPCKTAAAVSVRLIKALKASTRGADGGLSPFVHSCSPKFDQRRCQCLADNGRAVMPDIHQQFYRRDLIKSIINRNPLIGLQIAMACQISNY
ncbi:unnamed protein product [Chondrus crispus]|uniref:Uncharacterized protein n=1 Tax=Chondrus crispus TaxID=2769 RepID=R7QAP9_CHOCR|nr:unnamed protein product [Chondrus crispus]CDF34471.1 unnamed protein product [Chondrus crispus]|eukprot:XP_005714290.1 unnamed protein product [Chondrus crispus]